MMMMAVVSESNVHNNNRYRKKTIKMDKDENILMEAGTGTTFASSWARRTTSDTRDTVKDDN
jgi:hypothetical protein